MTRTGHPTMQRPVNLAGVEAVRRENPLVPRGGARAMAGRRERVDNDTQHFDPPSFSPRKLRAVHPTMVHPGAFCACASSLEIVWLFWLVLTLIDPHLQLRGTGDNVVGDHRWRDRCPTSDLTLHCLWQLRGSRSPGALWI
jgi:hypothetical protein